MNLHQDLFWNTTLEQIADSQRGSTSGGVFKAVDEKIYYVKFYNNIDQAHIEIIAQKINQRLGLAAPNLHLVRIKATDGNIIQGLASEWIDGLKRLTPDEMISHPDIGKAYLSAVLTKNWDIIGLNFDNLQQTPQGKLICVDAGGTFTFRAQGGFKVYGSDIAEITTLRDPQINPQTARIFDQALVDNPTLVFEVITKINREELSIAFRESGLSADDLKSLQNTFDARMNLLNDLYCRGSENCADYFDSVKSEMTYRSNNAQKYLNTSRNFTPFQNFMSRISKLIRTIAKTRS